MIVVSTPIYRSTIIFTSTTGNRALQESPPHVMLPSCYIRSQVAACKSGWTIGFFCSRTRCYGLKTALVWRITLGNLSCESVASRLNLLVSDVITFHFGKRGLVTRAAQREFSQRVSHSHISEEHHEFGYSVMMFWSSLRTYLPIYVGRGCDCLCKTYPGS